MTSLADGRARTPGLMVFAIRGALAVTLGAATAGLLVLAVLFPRVTANVMVLLFGAYLLLDGALTAATSMRPPEACRRWIRLQAALSICLGAAVVSGLILLGGPLLYLTGGWAIATGVLELAVARDLRRLYGVNTLIVSGLAALLFGAVTLIAWPGAGLMPFMWVLAIFALVLGFARIVAGFRST